MIHTVLFALWFMLPAAEANVMPILSAALPGLRRWDAPVDGGLRLRGKPLLGTHKTWRGLVTGVISALVVFWLLKLITHHSAWAHRVANDGIDYDGLSLWFGPVIGFGALAGDMIKSFAKRQFGIASGQSWMPFDQIDYIVGALVCSLPFVVLSWAQYAWIFVLWFGMHLLFSYIGYLLGFKEAPI
jgi:CDP-2,3-bis-(O-geranylgeranyl)-sn-glycerol synthase